MRVILTKKLCNYVLLCISLCRQRSDRVSCLRPTNSHLCLVAVAVLRQGTWGRAGEGYVGNWLAQLPGYNHNKHGAKHGPGPDSACVVITGCACLIR